MKVAADVATRHFPEKGPPRGVWNAGGNEFLFGLAHHRDFGNAVDAVGDHLDVVRIGDVKGMAGGQAALLHRRRGERGKADDIARRIDVWNGGLVVCVDRELPLLIGGQTNCSEIQCLRIADPSHSVEDHVGCHRFPVLELDRRPPCVVHGDAQMFLSEPHRDTVVLHLSVKGLCDFLVQEPQHLRPPIDEDYSDPEGGQHRGILGADNAPADDDDAGRILGGAEERVGITNDQVVEGNLRGTSWP